MRERPAKESRRADSNRRPTPFYRQTRAHPFHTHALAKSVVFLPRGYGGHYRKPSLPWEPGRSASSWRCVSRTRPRRLAGWGIQRPHLLAPALPLFFVALGRKGGLLRGSPNFSKARLIVEVDTLTPWTSSNSSQCSARVRSGFARAWAGSAASSAAPLRAGGPGTGLGSTSPVLRRSLR